MNYKKQKQYRLPKFDYSCEGEYFITICTKDKINYFGNIKNGEMALSVTGQIVDKIWVEIPRKFNNVSLDVFQVMPNHFHGIIIIKPNPRKNLIYQVQNRKNIINNVLRNQEYQIIQWYQIVFL